MAFAVPSADAAAKKWVTRAGQASGDYSNGVKDAGPKWQERTAAASKTYASGVNAAIGNDSFRKGVERAGAQRYASQAAGLGSQRYSGGVQAAASTFQARIAPVLNELASLKSSAPLRGPKGDAANYEISKHFGMGLRARKLAGW
jgi:hypothetical protein